MPQNKLSSLKGPMNVSAANALLDSLSLDHLRGSDQEQLSKFLHLCQHWQIFARRKSTGAPRLVRGPNASSNRSNPATGKAELALRGKPYKD